MTRTLGTAAARTTAATMRRKRRGARNPATRPRAIARQSPCPARPARRPLTASTTARALAGGAARSPRATTTAAIIPGCLATKINRGIGTRAAPSVATPRRLTTPGLNDPVCARRAVGTSAC